LDSKSIGAVFRFAQIKYLELIAALAAIFFDSI